jgi:hypothetical protein
MEIAPESDIADPQEGAYIELLGNAFLATTTCMSSDHRPRGGTS